MSQRHIIGRTVLEIDSDRLDDMWSFQNEISELLHQKSVPAMEQLFDRLVGADDVVRLDQVVVQLDPVDRRFLADEFVQNLLAALSETLGDRLANRLPMAAHAETMRGDRNRSNYGTNDASNDGAITEQSLITSETAPTRRDRAGADWEVLLYFLEYGRLPWWSLSEDLPSWIARWEAVMQEGTLWQAPLRELLRGYPSARQRLVMQFSESFLHQVVLQLQPTWLRWSDLLTQARNLLQSLSLSDLALRHLQTQAWVLLLVDLAQDSSRDRPLPVNQWMRGWLTALIQAWMVESQLEIGSVLRLDAPDIQSNTQSNTLQSAILSTGNRIGRSDTQNGKILDSWSIAHQSLHNLIEAISSPERSLWLTALDWVIPPSLRADSTSDRDSSNPSSNVNLTAIDEDREQARLFDEISPSDRDTITPSSDVEVNEIGEDLALTHAEDVSPRNGDSSISDEEAAVGIFVNQSGLVILHPFLQIYFEDVGLLDGDMFRDETAQQTAIYLLHYLATGQTDAPEYELVLPKLLCGWALNEPVTRGQALPETALAEGENMLQAVINYWQVLKSTSPDGLREGFLQREGKLTQMDEGSWRLQVEQKAIDILLGSLPWGLNVVKLPWMESMLMVEWS
jgi:hypothetical protein